ncbi:uncharacterized protein LOC105686858 [Athalia rosae]|uniref:uncharacterized protein LOC105686858 n=1 Tax=Athalia rosae TaxID=37344 RepID=UPI0020345BFA|nr:uncharacterized protein LOC105686858 [Athalia rosae]
MYNWLILIIFFSFPLDVKSLDSATIINDVCVPAQIADLEKYLERFTTPELTEFNTPPVPNAPINQENFFENTPFGLFPVDWKRLVTLHDHLPPDSEIKSKLLTLCRLLILAYDEVQNSSRNNSGSGSTTSDTSDSENDEENKKTLSLSTRSAGQRSEENEKITTVETSPSGRTLEDEKNEDDDELDVSVTKIDDLDVSYTIGSSTLIEDFDSTSTKFSPERTTDFHSESTSQGSMESSLTTLGTNMMEKSSDVKTDEIFDTTTTTYSTIGSEISDTVTSYVISGSTETPNNGEGMLEQTTSDALPKVTMKEKNYPRVEVEGTNHIVKNRLRDFSQQSSSQRESDFDNNKKYQEPTANTIDRDTQILPDGESGQKNGVKKTKEIRLGQSPYFIPFYNHPDAEFEFHRRSERPQGNENTAGFSKRAEHNTELGKLYRWFYRQGQEYAQPMQFNTQYVNYFSNFICFYLDKSYILAFCYRSHPNTPFLGEIKCTNMQVIG